MAVNSPNTTRAYEQACRDFELRTGVRAEGATLRDIERWLASMSDRGLAISTRRTRLAALRAIVGCLEPVVYPGFGSNGLAKTKAILSSEQIHAFLDAVKTGSSSAGLVDPQAKVRKAQNYALFVSLLLYGPQARTWTWGDLLDQHPSTPLIVWNAVREYMHALGFSVVMALSIEGRGVNCTGGNHWVSAPPLNDAVFSQLTQKMLRVEGGQIKESIHKLPVKATLTTQDVNRRVKHHAKLAGLDPKYVSLRTLVNTHRWLMAQYGNGDVAAERLGLSVAEPIPAQIVPWQKVGPLPSSRQDTRLHGIGRRSK